MIGELDTLDGACYIYSTECYCLSITDIRRPKMAEQKSFTLKVNGTEIDTLHQKLVAHDILELAEKNGAIPGRLKDYLLQGAKGQYGWGDWVDLEEDNLFITIPNKPTPVA